MKLKVYWISFLVVLFAVIVVANIPAKWGIKLANAPVQMSGITGSVWNGRAVSAVVPIQDTFFALGEVEWKLSPLSLLTAKPCADIKTKLDNQEITGNACFGLNGDLVLEDTQIAGSAKMAELLVPMIEVQGDVFVHVESLEMSNNQIQQAKASGNWREARFFNSTSWLGLGAIGFDLVEDGQGGAKANIFDVEGPIEIKLDSQFNLTGQYNTVGELSLRPNAPTELADLLNNYTNVSREIQEVLSLFVEKKGRDQYSVRWVSQQ